MHGSEFDPIPLERDPGGLPSGRDHSVAASSTASPELLISDLAMNAIRDGVLVSAGDGQIMAVNHSIREMTGFSSEELIGTRPPLLFWPPELHVKIGAAVADATREGGGEYDVTLQRKNGERFPAIVSVGVSPDHRSRVIVIKDITDRIALTAQLQAATQEAETGRMAFARSAELIGEFLYSSELLPDGHYVQLAQGPGIATLLGLDRDPENPSEAAAACVHPDDRSAYDRTWSYANLVELNGKIVEQAYRLIGHDGIVRWLRDRARITVTGRRVFLNGSTRDISAQRLVEEQRAETVGRLEWLSNVDSLTGLFNRRHFSDLLYAGGTSVSATTAIVLIDVDSFKRINDAYGHATGDAVLRAVAQRLKAALCASDLIARWGGEEFCVLFGLVHDDADLQGQAERLRLAITSTPIVVPHTPPIAVTVSLGVARAGRPTGDLFASADLALYEAKRAGRNRTRIAAADRRSANAPLLRVEPSS
jgi:diguanylate cyclase (GGDEF)-like protein/PAS domain S-box-containing protein